MKIGTQVIVQRDEKKYPSRGTWPRFRGKRGTVTGTSHGEIGVVFCADYAFTTLVPQLGMVEYRDGKSFCIADLPGIIEGAAEGKGLGHRFLRHIERNSVLLFLLPADSKNHKEEFAILKNELEQYNPEMLQKDFVIAISKSDMLDDELKAAIKKELPRKIPHVFISSVTGQGLQELKDLLWKTLNGSPKDN